MFESARASPIGSEDGDGRVESCVAGGIVTIERDAEVMSAATSYTSLTSILSNQSRQCFNSCGTMPKDLEL